MLYPTKVTKIYTICTLALYDISVYFICRLIDELEAKLAGIALPNMRPRTAQNLPPSLARTSINVEPPFFNDSATQSLVAGTDVQATPRTARRIANATGEAGALSNSATWDTTTTMQSSRSPANGESGGEGAIIRSNISRGFIEASRRPPSAAPSYSSSPAMPMKPSRMSTPLSRPFSAKVVLSALTVNAYEVCWLPGI